MVTSIQCASPKPHKEEDCSMKFIKTILIISCALFIQSASSVRAMDTQHYPEIFNEPDMVTSLVKAFGNKTPLTTFYNFCMTNKQIYADYWNDNNIFWQTICKQGGYLNEELINQNQSNPFFYRPLLLAIEKDMSELINISLDMDIGKKCKIVIETPLHPSKILEILTKVRTIEKRFYSYKPQMDRCCDIIMNLVEKFQGSEDNVVKNILNDSVLDLETHRKQNKNPLLDLEKFMEDLTNKLYAVLGEERLIFVGEPLDIYKNRKFICNNPQNPLCNSPLHPLSIFSLEARYTLWVSEGASLFYLSGSTPEERDSFGVRCKSASEYLRLTCPDLRDVKYSQTLFATSLGVLKRYWLTMLSLDFFQKHPVASLFFSLGVRLEHKYYLIDSNSKNMIAKETMDPKYIFNNKYPVDLGNEFVVDIQSLYDKRKPCLEFALREMPETRALYEKALEHETFPDDSEL